MILSFSGCEDLFKDDEDEESSLYVKFENDSNSEFTITTIQTRERGEVGNTTEPTATWSENLLKNGATLAPGASFYFTLKIPSGEWAEYRLGVNNGQSVQVMLYDQPGYAGMTDLPITHWGSDERTVGVSIVYDEDTETIVVNGWSDWAGIED